MSAHATSGEIAVDVEIMGKPWTLTMFLEAKPTSLWLIGLRQDRFDKNRDSLRGLVDPYDRGYFSKNVLVRADNIDEAAQCATVYAARLRVLITAWLTWRDAQIAFASEHAAMDGWDRAAWDDYWSKA